MRFRIRQMAPSQAAEYPHALMGWEKGDPIWEVRVRRWGLFWCDVGRVFRTQDAALGYIKRQAEPAGSWLEVG